MPDMLSVLVIGAGRMGRVHLETLDTSIAAVAVAVVDPVEAVRAELSQHGLVTHASLDDALDAGGFDAALIAAPSDLHLSLVRQLIGAGVPTLCEKPCGLDSAETRVVSRLSSEADVLLQVGYWRRFVPELRRLRRRIASGELGEIALAQSWQWDEAPPPVAFRLRSGGIVRDMGVHEIDQLRWLTGEELSIDAVVESGVNSDPPVEGDPESVAVTGTLSGGGVALISLGRRYARGDSCWVEVIGTRGTERCDFMIGSEGDRVFRRALVDQIDAFAAAVGGEPSIGATAADAVAALVAVEQAQQ